MLFLLTWDSAQRTETYLHEADAEHFGFSIVCEHIYFVCVDECISYHVSLKSHECELNVCQSSMHEDKPLQVLASHIAVTV